LLATFVLSLAYCAATSSAQACAFDQAAVAKNLATIAARNPGAAFSPEEKSYAWRLGSGETVVVARFTTRNSATGLTNKIHLNTFELK
jgi:hypothetical protein